MRSFGFVFAVLATSAVLATACSSEPAAEDDLASEGDAITNVARPDSHPDLLVKDPATLVALESRFSFASMLGATGTSGADLAASSAAYRTIAKTVKADVDTTHASDPDSGKGFSFSHRLFDDQWLTSHAVRFELTGIANRIDLAYRGGCGEIHFVYRMAYTTGTGTDKIDSRLPMTANVLVPIPDDGQQCRTVAQSWATVSGSVATKLLAGPLAHVAKPSRVELNFQLVRWPSGNRADMGGQAEYMLHAFALANGDLTPVALEDTPRTDLRGEDLAALKTWIGDNLAQIDQGTARIPERFLATSTRSVAPRAPVRLANHNFHGLFEARDFDALPLSSTTTIKSPEALLHKLDGLTCEGCHQSRGIAGFHLLGEERSGTMRLNALAVGASPHLVDALAWREQLNQAVAAGQTPPKRNAPDHASGKPGGYGDHCGLGSDPGFGDWTCKSGYSCQRIDDDTLGRCLPTTKEMGDACENTNVTQTLDSHADKASIKPIACASGVTCMGSKSGFPDGECVAQCESLGTVTGSSICAPVPFGTGPLGGFNNCLFKLKKPFAECLADDAAPVASRMCDEANPCRDDYACARVYVKPGGAAGADPVEQAPEAGACMPPYFVFQGRVDGHVIPQ